MKTGIITFHNAPSYGAFFQTFAMQKAIERLGHEAVVLDYMPRHRRERFPGFKENLKWSRLGMNRSNLNAFKNYKRTYHLSQQRKTFTDAASQHLNLTNDSWDSLEELRTNPPNLEALVVGSDQIWNADKTGESYDPAYFGDFGPTKLRRIAYAASFGTKRAANPEQLSRLLSGIDRISVRERSGVDLARKHTKTEVDFVLDPTFLLTKADYPDSAPVKQLKMEPYVLGYILNQSEVARNALNRAGQLLGVKTIDLAEGSEARLPWCYSPTEVLHLLKNAEFVVTNSFHGLSMSINFEKPFYCVGLEGNAGVLNERLKCLLNELGMQSSFNEPGKSELLPAMVEAPDWSIANTRLSKLRSESFNFLKASFSSYFSP
ncbi:MAG: polysaccharide pyruvyl transferase family protein [Rhodopirellula sp. JB053]